MLFEGDKVILCHGVVDLRKGAIGLLSLVPEPEPSTTNSVLDTLL